MDTLDRITLGFAVALSLFNSFDIHITAKRADANSVRLNEQNLIIDALTEQTEGVVVEIKKQDDNTRSISEILAVHLPERN